MARLFATLLACVCVATVATQGLAVGVLALNGRLTPSTWEAIRAALDAPAPPPAVVVPAGDEPAPAGDEPRRPTYEEVLERRALAVLRLQDRTEQLRTAARAVLAEADRVEAERAAVAAARAGFAAELARVRADLTDEATEQTRALLKTMPPKAAVGYLMTVPDARAAGLAKGLDERTAAKLLGEFARGTDAEAAKGAALFDALQRGGPEAAALDAAAASALPPAAPPAR